MSAPEAPETRSRQRPRLRTKVGESPISATGIVILAVLMAAIAVLALYGLWSFWPAPLPLTGQAPASATFSYFGWHRTLTRDQQFFVVAALAGELGAMLHGLRSLSTYVGERYLFRSWIAYYALLPVVGGLISTIVYLVLRAGFLPAASRASQPDPYGVAGIGALMGLFSAQAAEKLQAVFETLFTKAAARNEPYTDATMPATAPAITKFRPRRGKAGASIRISGDNLTSVTGVEFTGAKAPKFKKVSDKRLTVSVPKGAATGPIILHAGQAQATSGQGFTVTK